MSRMPKQNRGQSKQDYGTPPELISAVLKKVGIPEFDIDLAASEDNTVAQMYFDEQTNSLVQDWHNFGWAWLNPPFQDITPWVRKAEEESRLGAKICMLVPASVGSNWWAQYVDHRAHVLLMNGRVQFVGASDPYVKDCAILVYTKWVRGGQQIWKWKAEK